jgi:biopolymer transport protein ExbD
MIDSAPIRIRTNLQPRSSLTDFTPFISVFFLLVFFFMLSSSFIQISGIAVDLPPGNTKMYDVKKMVVTVTADNKVTLTMRNLTVLMSSRTILLP